MTMSEPKIEPFAPKLIVVDGRLYGRYDLLPSPVDTLVVRVDGVLGEYKSFDAAIEWYMENRREWVDGFGDSVWSYDLGHWVISHRNIEQLDHALQLEAFAVHRRRGLNLGEIRRREQGANAYRTRTRPRGPSRIAPEPRN
jgi:hypothetical protein